MGVVATQADWHPTLHPTRITYTLPNRPFAWPIPQTYVHGSTSACFLAHTNGVTREKRFATDRPMGAKFALRNLYLSNRIESDEFQKLTTFPGRYSDFLLHLGKIVSKPSCRTADSNSRSERADIETVMAIGNDFLRLHSNSRSERADIETTCSSAVMSCVTT